MRTFNQLETQRISKEVLSLVDLSTNNSETLKVIPETKQTGGKAGHVSTQHKLTIDHRITIEFKKTSQAHRLVKFRPRSKSKYTPTTSIDATVIEDDSEDNTEDAGKLVLQKTEAEYASNSLDNTNERSVSLFGSEHNTFIGNVSVEEKCMDEKNAVESLYQLGVRSKSKYTPKISTDATIIEDDSEDNTELNTEEPGKLALQRMEIENASDRLDNINERSVSLFGSDHNIFIGNVSVEKKFMNEKYAVESLYKYKVQTTDINKQGCFAQKASYYEKTFSTILHTDMFQLIVLFLLTLTAIVYRGLKRITNNIQNHDGRTNREIRLIPYVVQSRTPFASLKPKPSKQIAHGCLNNAMVGNCDQLIQDKISNLTSILKNQENTKDNILSREPVETDNNTALQGDGKYNYDILSERKDTNNIAADPVPSISCLNSVNKDETCNRRISESTTKHKLQTANVLPPLGSECDSTGDGQNEVRNVSLGNFPVGAQEKCLSTVADNTVAELLPNPVLIIQMYMGTFFFTQQPTLGLYKREIRLNVVTTDMFDDAIRNSVTLTDMTYSIWFPRNCRLYEWIPVLRGGYVHTKDELHRIR